MAENGEILRVTVNYSILGSSIPQNVFHFRIDGAAKSDAETVEDIDTWLTETWGTRWDNGASEDAQMSGGNIDVMNGDGTVARTLGDFLSATVGAVAQDVDPAGVAGLLLANTAVPKASGRKYVPGIHKTATVDGYFNAGSIAYFATLLFDYINAYATGGTVYTPGVLSTVIEAFIAFNGAGAVSDVPAYQRRRKPGVGT